MKLRERLTDEVWLNALLATDGRWKQGPIMLGRVERIGDGYGLSGDIQRLHATIASGEPITLVAKVEDARRTRRALTAHRRVEALMGASMPACYGSRLDADEGLLLLQDVSPAIQGDELEPCSRQRAVEVVQTVALLHDHTAMPGPGVEPWQAPRADEAWWTARVAMAAGRYPSLFGEEARERIEQLPGQIAGAASMLGRESTGWVHVDCHLDNVLWRPDGTAVLLDWSNARVGPPVVDVATMLFSLAFSDAAVMAPGELIAVYASATARPGREQDLARLSAAASAALVIHLRGILGWAGEPTNSGFHERKTRLRDDAIRRLFRAIEWIDLVSPPRPG